MTIAAQLHAASLLLTECAAAELETWREALVFDRYVGSTNVAARVWPRAEASNRLALAAHDAWMNAKEAAR